MAQGSTSTGRALVLDPISKLTDDLLLEILSRVPYKSTRCCKCVSTRWRDLIAHPDSRKKMPQTLVGFFNETEVDPEWVPCYTDVSEGDYPRFDQPLSFLMSDCKDLDMHDSCNGLLLLQPKIPDYVVCNPVTEKWVTVPASFWSRSVGIVHPCLGFDPAVSSHFHLFEFLPGPVWDAKSGRQTYGTKSFGIYSSKAGSWTYGEIWDSQITSFSPSRSSFLDGVLYLSYHGEDFLIAVDVKANYRVIRIPTPHSAGDVYNAYPSQGQLHLAYKSGSALSIWILEDPSSGNLTLKRNISHLQLLGDEYSSFGGDYYVVSIHPERNVIFIVCPSETAPSPRSTLISYDMDSGERRFICHQVGGATTYLPFVPLFSELLADEH